MTFRANGVLYFCAVALLILLTGAAGAAAQEHVHPAPPAADPAGSGSFFGDLFRVYQPRRVCMNNEGPVIGLHLVADVLIAASYYSIPVALVYFVRKRRDIAFNWIFVMFAAFILACGTTHLFAVWALWHPLYRLDGIVKLITAALSVATAVVLWPLIPKALALPSPARLEERVRERTAELDRANGALRGEMAARAAAEVAQARMAAIVAGSDDAVVAKTLEGVITSWNHGAERLFGYTADEAIGRPMTIVIPPERRDEEATILGRLRRGEPIDHFETVRVTKDGRQLDVSVTVSAIKDAGGRVVGASKIARDITGRKRVERERAEVLERERAARGEAERASRMKDEFLATLSHELRTPLNSIYGWAQMLRRRNVEDPEMRQGLEVIERNTRAQTQLIDDLLDMSRIISGKVRLDVRPLELASIVDEAIRSVEPAASARDIRLHRMLDPLAGPVSGDPARLQQVLWNLLTNAIKFTPKGGKVQVFLERVNSHVEITITDTGQGITPEFLPHVFERFRQGDSSSTRRHGGLGLGLAIVKNLVELHGGTVRAKSPGENQGSSFIVCLPVRAVQAAADRAEQPRHAAAAGGGGAAPGDDVLPSLAGLRVLVVDDEPDARDLIRRLLSQTGAVVTTASSAAEAMEVMTAADGARPQILLSDIGMPDEDGYGLLRRIRRLPAAAGGEIPAVALTAFARSEDRMRAMLGGFQMHLAKPVDAAELVAVIASLAGVLRVGAEPVKPA